MIISTLFPLTLLRSMRFSSHPFYAFFSFPHRGNLSHPNILGCKAFHWSLVHSSGIIPLDETYPSVPSSYQVPVAPWWGMEFYVCLLFPCWDLALLGTDRSYIWNLSHPLWVPVQLLLYPESTVYLWVSIPSMIFLHSFSRKWYSIYIPFRAGHSAVSCSLHVG